MEPSGRFKEKGPVSSLRWGPSVAWLPSMKCFFPVEISILVYPKQISMVSKSEKQKRRKKKDLLYHPLPPVMPLRPWWCSCLHFFSFLSLLFFFGGGGGQVSWFLGEECLEYKILGGACQQLLTLPTLKSTTGVATDSCLACKSLRIDFQTLQSAPTFFFHTFPTTTQDRLG